MAQRDMILPFATIAKLVARRQKPRKRCWPPTPTSEFDSKVPNSKETTQRFVTQVYAELKAMPAR